MTRKSPEDPTGGSGNSTIITGEFDAVDNGPSRVRYTDFPLRDRFALTYMEIIMEAKLPQQGWDFDIEVHAANAYTFADIMLRARDQTKR